MLAQAWSVVNRKPLVVSQGFLSVSLSIFIVELLALAEFA